MKIDRYYDITCGDCGRHYSTDFGHGMETQLNVIKIKAEREGWGQSRKYGNLCPVCNHVINLTEFITRYL